MHYINTMTPNLKVEAGCKLIAEYTKTTRCQLQTCWHVADCGGSGSWRMAASASLATDEVSDTFEKPLIDVVSLQKVVSSRPWVLTDTVRQFEWRSIFVQLDVKYKVVLL